MVEAVRLRLAGRRGVSDEALAAGVGRGLGAVGGAGLVEEISHVGAHRRRADEQFLGDLPVCLSGGHQAEHLHLTLGQTVGVNGRRDRLGFGLLLKGDGPLHQGPHAEFGGDS